MTCPVEEASGSAFKFRVADGAIEFLFAELKCPAQGALTVLSEIGDK